MEDDGSYVATCPQLGCIFVHEASEEAAYRHAREAVEAYLRTSIEHGDPIPEDMLLDHEVVQEPVERQATRTPAPVHVLNLTASYTFPLQRQA